jgi:radical SAM protein with 4Fe4S-binding SPASM domain
MPKKKHLSAPLDACISITKRCNLKCKHCCTDVSLDDNELSYEEITRIIDELKDAKIFRLHIFGGEPLVRKDFFDILRYGKKKKFALAINTNCTLVNDSTVQELKKLWPIGIATSLDGSTAKIHDMLRGKGAFDKAVRGIKKLTGAGFPLVAEAVVTKYNLDDLVRIAAFAKSIGIRRMRYIPVFYGGQAKCFQSDISPNPEDYKKGAEIARELLSKFPDFAEGAFVDGLTQIEGYKKLKRKKYQRAAKLSLCGAGRLTVGIRSDGMVIPCSAIWDIPCGSLREKSFLEIWNNSDVLDRFRNIDRVSMDSIAECKTCELKYFCQGNCKAAQYHYSGSISGFCPDCNYFR